MRRNFPIQFFDHISGRFCLGLSLRRTTLLLTSAGWFWQNSFQLWRVDINCNGFSAFYIPALVHQTLSITFVWWIAGSVPLPVIIHNLYFITCQYMVSERGFILSRRQIVQASFSLAQETGNRVVKFPRHSKGIQMRSGHSRPVCKLLVNFMKLPLFPSLAGLFQGWMDD